MIITIDQTSPDALYLQIRQQIIAAIARGELKPGDSLPSLRSLAQDLGINLHTVNKAYALLCDEGYLLMRGRSGAFVADPPSQSMPMRAQMIEERIQKSLQQLAQEHKAAGGTKDAFMKEAEAVCDAVYGDPGTAGARRNVRVLGVDDQGEPLNARGRIVEPGLPGTPFNEINPARS